MGRRVHVYLSALARAADSGFLPRRKKKISPPPLQQWRTGKETQQTASYARWPMAANDVDTTNHCLIIFDTIEKDINMYNIVGPQATIRTAGPR